MRFLGWILGLLCYFYTPTHDMWSKIQVVRLGRVILMLVLEVPWEEGTYLCGKMLRVIMRWRVDY